MFYFSDGKEGGGDPIGSLDGREFQLFISMAVSTSSSTSLPSPDWLGELQACLNRWVSTNPRRLWINKSGLSPKNREWMGMANSCNDTSIFLSRSCSNTYQAKPLGNTYKRKKKYIEKKIKNRPQINSKWLCNGICMKALTICCMYTCMQEVPKTRLIAVKVCVCFRQKKKWLESFLWVRW